ncbi:50S ribosomal protein L11 methyltransferase [Thermovibrio sp.]
MEYKEITFKVPKEDYERVLGELFEEGCLGTCTIKENKEVEFKAYFKEEPRLGKELSKFIKGKESLKERNWNEEWKRYYKPVRVSERVWVVPSWEKGKFKEPEGAIVIYIYPGRGFGTGTHETTRLSMKFIEEVLKERDSFLDIGTGSGILSILARKLGAERVVACDVQEGIEEEVERNSKLSGVNGIKFVKGSVDKVKGEFEVVVANIEKHLLEPLLPLIAERAKEKVILSGILKEQREEFLKKCKELGLKPVKEKGEGRWVAFLFTK